MIYSAALNRQLVETERQNIDGGLTLAARSLKGSFTLILQT